MTKSHFKFFLLPLLLLIALVGFYMGGRNDNIGTSRPQTVEELQPRSPQLIGHRALLSANPHSIAEDVTSTKSSQPVVIQIDASAAKVAQHLLNAPLALELGQVKVNEQYDPEYRELLASLGLPSEKIDSIISIVHERKLAEARMRMERLSRGSQTVEQFHAQSEDIQSIKTDFDRNIEAEISDPYIARTFFQWEASLPFLSQARNFVSSLSDPLPSDATQAIANALFSANTQETQGATRSTLQLRQARLRQALLEYAPGLLTPHQQALLVERYAQKVTLVR
jgi:hypothetical protein